MADKPKQLVQVEMRRDLVEVLQRHCDNDEQEEVPIRRNPFYRPPEQEKK